MATVSHITCDRCAATIPGYRDKYGLQVETPIGVGEYAPRKDLCRGCLASLERWLADGRPSP